MSIIQGRSQKFVLGGIKVFGGIKLFNSRSDVILPHKKFTGMIFFLGGGINTNIHPVATPMVLLYVKKTTIGH